MDKRFLKNFLTHLSKPAYEAFVINLFNEPKNQEPFESFPEIGEGVFRQKLLDSYGGSIHALYIIHFLPIEVFNHPKQVAIADPSIIGKLSRIRNMYTGQLGQWGMVSPHLVPGKRLNEVWFLNNFADINKNKYEDIVFPRYQKMLKKFKVTPHLWGVGSCDSFVEKNLDGVKRAIETLFSQKGEGLCISLQEEQVSVQRLICEKSIFAGVSQNRKQPYEPIYIDALRKKEDVLSEFEQLIKKGAKESELEKFISAHYIDIFGPKYNGIETQLWLRFPELDIKGKERRLDVFLRNSVTNDWELFELKRPVKLTSTYRDVPIIAHEVTHAIQQIKNYAKILSQDVVKKKFAKEGIEYYEPSLNLVIGKTPQIPLSQWRWLLKTNEKELKIFTYDALLKEMQLRRNDLLRMFRQTRDI